MVFISKIREMSLQRFPVLGERARTSRAAAAFLRRAGPGLEEETTAGSLNASSPPWQPPLLPFLPSKHFQIYIKCVFSQTRACLCLHQAPGGGLYSLKSTTPDIWGVSNNKHLSIVLCDWPVGLPLSWRLGWGGVKGIVEATC